MMGEPHLPPYHLLIRPEEVIHYDLAQLKLEWPLSCYGLNLSWHTGDNIIHGDYSQEELRCEAYAQSRTIGNIDAYRQTLSHVLRERSNQIASILSNPSHAVTLARTPRHAANGAMVGGAGYGGAHQRQGRDALQHAPSLAHSASLASSSSIPEISPLSNYDPSGSTLADRSLMLDSFTFGDIPELPPAPYS